MSRTQRGKHRLLRNLPVCVRRRRSVRGRREAGICDSKHCPAPEWPGSQETRQDRVAATGTGGGDVDHRRATDGQHDSQNQPTPVNDDTSCNPCELRVFNDCQQQSITMRWHSQGGSAGSNPVGATHHHRRSAPVWRRLRAPPGVPFLAPGQQLCNNSFDWSRKVGDRCGAGGLLVREQGALTTYRRFWGARSGHVDRQNLNGALGFRKDCVIGVA